MKCGVAVLICSIPLLALAADSTRPDWGEVLGPSQGALPAPLAEVRWLPDLHQGLEQAKAQNRPLFVTLRCLPCKQCSAFDKDVLEGGPQLDPLLRQFVTVRLVSAKSIDLRLLPIQGYQDLDLSWWGYLLSPRGQIYAIFGGRDEVSDETRISVPALANTLRRVLAWHYDPRRPGWDLDGPAPDLSAPQKDPTSLPGFRAWFGHATPQLKAQVTTQNCIHCHQVNEIVREPAVEAGTFDKDKDLQIWPLPENVGITLERDDGLKVIKVKDGSPAANAGLQAGDELAAARGPEGWRRLFGQADFRGVLHRSPAGPANIDLVWIRGGEPIAAQISVAGDWKRTVLDWRMSVSQGNVGAGPGFFPIAKGAADRKRLGIPEGSLAVQAWTGPKDQGPASAAGLSREYVVTAVDGQSPNLAGRAFLVWFRLHHDVGDTVHVTAKDAKGRAKEFAYTLKGKDW